ncbi:hypothetical protein EDC04DRAFT_1658038 [Pisolithus marmoratus]|nr:hypothetical protein EDC04DRAFT_1658038 [Pisolithus marmoratus]
MMASTDLSGLGCAPRHQLDSHQQRSPCRIFTPNTAEFFRTSTGIENEETLKAHILIVQEMAYKALLRYPCIYGFTFLKYFACSQCSI